MNGNDKSVYIYINYALFLFSAFIFCWSPYFVFDLLFVYGQIPDPNSERVSAMNTFIQSLAPLNSAVNPFIFLLFNFNTVKNVYRRGNRHLYSPPTTQTHLWLKRNAWRTFLRFFLFLFIWIYSKNVIFQLYILQIYIIWVIFV